MVIFQQLFSTLVNYCSQRWREDFKLTQKKENHFSHSHWYESNCVKSSKIIVINF